MDQNDIDALQVIIDAALKSGGIAIMAPARRIEDTISIAIQEAKDKNKKKGEE
jgi:hypothetical protein